MARCKGCGAEIIWALTENGKRIPLDADSEEQRFAIRDKTETPPRTAVVTTFVSHFATCPQADRFRRS